MESTALAENIYVSLPTPIIDNSWVTLQIVASLTYDSRGAIYDCNTFMAQTTGLVVEDKKGFEKKLKFFISLIIKFSHSGKSLLCLHHFYLQPSHIKHLHTPFIGTQ